MSMGSVKYGPVRSSEATESTADEFGPYGRHGRIVELDIQRELKDSYLTYAMSTIMDRALPDVRDGLKPSQRRILVAMNDLNLRPNRKHLKCAKIAGNTSGDYHPHGEAVIYPTLVGMTQPWRMRVPVIDPQGNFGSINGDPPAAMRYTEARMTPAAVDMLADLKLDTVDFQPNYDDRLMEPTVLPGRFPYLLINGGLGIAVGMATSLPPQNPTEILDSIIRVIDDPDIELDALTKDVLDEEGNIVRYGAKGPDFPTGGVIHGRRGIHEAYLTGRGKVTMRGTCHIEPLSKDRKQIVIDTIPYNMVQEGLVKKIVDAVEDDRITGVSDVRDESGREAQTRIVIELKRDTDPAVVEKQLYEFTPLQDTFSINNLALVNRQPKTMGLIQLIECYIDHRVEVITRRTQYLLREARKRAHVLEGLIFAVCDIDEVIRQIRASKSRDEAIERLMTMQFRIPPEHPLAPRIPKSLMTAVQGAGPNGMQLTRVQAEAIGAMRLIQLTGLEIERLASEYTALSTEIDGYKAILADHQLVLGIIRTDCEEMRVRYASPRLTSIEEAAADISYADLIPRSTVALTISHKGYIKRVPLETYRAQGRGGKGIKASDSKDDDFVEHLFVAETHDDLLCFTNTGRVFKIKVFEVPEMSRTSLGRAIVNLIGLKEGEHTCAYLSVRNFEEGSDFLTFVSRNGIIKRTPLKDYRNVSAGGLIAVGLKEDDSLLNVILTDGTDDVLLATAGGAAIRFSEHDVRVMGRPAAGVKGIDLSADDAVIGIVRVSMEPDADGDLMTKDPTVKLLTITDKGYGKRTALDEYRVQPQEGKARSQSRGGKGRVDIKLTEKNGRSVAALSVLDTDDVVVITKAGLLVRTSVAEIRDCGRGTQGVRVVTLNGGDEVISAAKIAIDEDEAPEVAEGETDSKESGNGPVATADTPSPE